MNYIKIYDSIIEKAKNRSFVEGMYYEKHHIIPKCLGGNNEKNNIVKLTPKEHFICHYLLHFNDKSNSKLAFAVWNMCKISPTQNRRIISGRLYEYSKELYIKNIKKTNIDRKHIYNLETNEAKLVKNDILSSYLKDGWVLRCISTGTANHTTIYNPVNDIYKVIHSNKLSKYIKDGWIKKGKSGTKDRICITDISTKKRIFVKKCEISNYINNDRYKIGIAHTNTEGKTSMYKDDNYKMIPNIDVTSYLDKGWIKKGKSRNKGIKSTLKNTCVVSKDGKSTFIKKDDLQKFLENGWVDGRPNTAHNKDKCRISKNNIIKYIKKDDLQKFLEDGWV